MSNATLKEKTVSQAKEITHLQAEVNYLIEELYKVKSDHELFLKSPEMTEQIKKNIEAQRPKNMGVGSTGSQG